MLEALIPREKIFFELFVKAAGKTVEACRMFEAMLGDLEHAESHARRIKAFEHEADEVAHQAVDTIHKTFVTPIDRHDIHRLVKRLDDVLDMVESAAERLHLYAIREPMPEAKELARVLTQAAEHVAKALRDLENAKKRPHDVLETCIEINRLENDGDAILRRALARLFQEQEDLRTIMKWKEICELLEIAVDRCEDVANIIEGIVVEMG